MTDARINTEFPEHFKTQKLIARLGVPGAWHLLRLWLWATANKPSGKLDGMTDEDIELAAKWPGESGLLVATLIEVKYVAGRAGARHLHDWQEHNPWAAGAEMRSAKARWNAVFGHHGKSEADRQVPEWAAVRAANRAARKADSSADSRPDSSAPSPSPTPSPKSEKQKPSPARGSRLPAGWRPPPELWDWARVEVPEWNAPRHERELETFRDYWTAQPGSKGVKLDWDATYRNWIRRSGGQHGTRTGNSSRGRRASAVEDMQDAVEQRARDRARGNGDLF